MLNKIAREVHQNAKDKGFWDEPVEKGTQLMLVTSELGEGLEALRKGRRANLEAYHERIKELSDSYNKRSGKDATEAINENFKKSFLTHIKDTYEDELADALIRILDMSAADGIDIEKHVYLKMRYNSLREYKHGKEF